MGWRYGVLAALAIGMLAVAAAVLLGGTQRPPGQPPEPSPNEPGETRTPDSRTPAAAPTPRASDAAVPRLGLFHTAADVALWRERSEHGPYRVQGDAFPRSPGEWSAVTQDAAAVRADPDSFLWELRTGEGCVPSDDHGIDLEGPRDRSRALAGAALYALVEQDSELAAIVGRVLVEQVERPGVDFGDRSRWCAPGNHDTGPVFALTHAMVSQLLAFDLLPEGTLSESDADRVRRWHLDLADLIDLEIEDIHGEVFQDRGRSDRRLTAEWAEPQTLNWWNGGDARMWADSPQVYRLHNLYNNRWAAMARYQGLVGLAVGDENHRDAATLFFEEFVDFGVFPEGAHTDLHRGFHDRRAPDDVVVGLDYMTLAAVHAFTYAEALARSGDSSLYEYASTEGAQGSQGAPPAEYGNAKSLLFLAHSLARYADGTFERYVSEGSDESFRLSWTRVNSGTWSRTAILSGYFQDPYVHRLYRGDGEGMPAWPEDGAPHRWDAGDSGAFPAWMLMFADREDQAIDVYGIERPDVDQSVSPTSEPSAAASDAAPSQQPVPIRINAGGPALAEGGWAADSYDEPSAFASFSDNRVEDASEARAGPTVEEHVPDALFATLRWRSTREGHHLRYVLPRGPGDYVLRLHFVEREHTSAGKRLFHVDVDGDRRLEAFDVVGEAGAPGIGVSHEFSLSYTSDGETVVELLPGGADAPVISGLELVPQP